MIIPARVSSSLCMPRASVVKALFCPVQISGRFLYDLSSAQMCDNLAVMLFPTPEYSLLLQCSHFLIMLFCLHVLSVYAERCQGFVEFQPRFGLVRHSVLQNVFG